MHAILTAQKVSSYTVQPLELTAVCDLAALYDRCLGDESLAADLLERFGERLNGTVGDIRQLLADGKCAETLKRVHSLKGEAGSLAAVAVQKAAIDLEKCLRSQEHDGVVRCTSALVAAAEEFCHNLPLLLDCLSSQAK